MYNEASTAGTHWRTAPATLTVASNTRTLPSAEATASCHRTAPATFIAPRRARPMPSKPDAGNDPPTLPSSEAVAPRRPAQFITPRRAALLHDHLAPAIATAAGDNPCVPPSSQVAVEAQQDALRRPTVTCAREPHNA